VGISISSRLDDEFNSVFRILIASLDQLICMAKNTSKIQCCACFRQRQKITGIPLKSVPYTSVIYNNTSNTAYFDIVCGVLFYNTIIIYYLLLISRAGILMQRHLVFWCFVTLIRIKCVFGDTDYYKVFFYFAFFCVIWQI